MDKNTIKAAFKERAALMKSQMKGKKIKMDCEKILSERMKDAENALKSGYNEQAEFDAALISVVLGLCEKTPPMNGSQPPRMVADANAPDYASMACGELKSANIYGEIYKSTGDDMFRHIAKQKLGHAAALSEKAASNAKTSEEQATAKDIKMRLMEMEKIIR